MTGPSGYVGAHVLDQLLSKGYKVRGTVRSQRKIDQITAKYPHVGDQLELVIVPDVQLDGIFDSLLHGMQYQRCW